ncbi:MAG TPA: hypothetical protein VM913_07650, partial [Sphingomicrobium sp.]|nr:hypothetical protein [Sphingomicrobium sp.]
MGRVSISQAWAETAAALRRDSRLFAPVALAFLVLPGTLSDLGSPRATLPPGAAGALWSLLLLIVVIASLVGQLTIQWLALTPS